MTTSDPRGPRALVRSAATLRNIGTLALAAFVVGHISRPDLMTTRSWNIATGTSLLVLGVGIVLREPSRATRVFGVCVILVAMVAIVWSAATEL